ncbi:unnamed protein product, partial [Aphanomyces euteiches]
MGNESPRNSPDNVIHSSAEPASQAEQAPAISGEHSSTSCRARLPALADPSCPPTYNGTTSMEKTVFMLAYKQYWFQYHLGFPTVCIPVGAYVPDVRRRNIAKFELRKQADQITEQEWCHYFHKANKVRIIDYARADRVMKNLRMNTSPTDESSRISKLLQKLKLHLEQLSMESYFDTEQKRVVRYL